MGKPSQARGVLTGIGVILAVLAAEAMAAGDQNSYSNFRTNVHPGFTVGTLGLPSNYSNMGIDWLSNGSMVLTNCESHDSYEGGGIPQPTVEAGVYIVSNPTGAPTLRQVASMFRQPSGGVVVNDTVYVSDRDGFYRINSLNPANIALNRTLVVSWPHETSPSDFGNYWDNGYWHQFVFCPHYYNGRFYAVYSGTIRGGGPSTSGPSTSYSGAYLSWDKSGSGGLQKFAGGFRSPNGGGMGPGGMFMVTDNQGSWEPSCPLHMVRPNRFYGHRQNAGYTPNWAQTAYLAGSLPYDPPVAWMLDGSGVNGENQAGPGQSTSQPLYVDRGPYAGDWIVGDCNAVGISRVALDPVNGGNGTTANYNGSVTYFTGGSFARTGTEAAVNRLSMHPTQNIVYVGTIGLAGNWPSVPAQPLYTITINDAAAAASFEILAVKSRLNGVEIVFSQPIDSSKAVKGNFTLFQYNIVRQDNYGDGNNRQATPPAIGTVQVSGDRKRVFLEIGNQAAIDRVLKIRIAAGFTSATGQALWFSEAYFTHNYQSNQAFSPVPIAEKPRVDKFMENHVSHTLLQGTLNVKVDLEGAYQVSLASFDGRKVREKKGSAPSEFNFQAPGKGLYILQVQRGGRAYVRPVMF